MASMKERQRWDQWFTQVTARIERQKVIITRLVAINTESIAALEEIAAWEGGPQADANVCAERAREALVRIKGSAAAPVVEEASSYEEDTPVEDPRSRA